MPKRARACIKRERPSWWTQEGVLSKLQSGEFILAICQQAVEAMTGAGISISVSRLRAEVAEWCESASWGPQLTAALSLWHKTGSGEMALSKHWHDDFLGAMQVTEGNAQKAASMAGIGYGIVLAVMDRRNKCYDPEFAERFRVAELERIGRVREQYMTMAEEGEGKAAARAQERLIEAALPALHGQKQEVHVSGKVDHAHEHLHGFAPELAREIVIASQDRVRRINAGRNLELPADRREDEGRVIDLVPHRQEVPA